jgi:hypothetical protein
MANKVDAGFVMGGIRGGDLKEIKKSRAQTLIIRIM